MYECQGLGWAGKSWAAGIRKEPIRKEAKWKQQSSFWSLRCNNTSKGQTKESTDSPLFHSSHAAARTLGLSHCPGSPDQNVLQFRGPWARGGGQRRLRVGKDWALSQSGEKCLPGPHPFPQNELWAQKPEVEVSAFLFSLPEKDASEWAAWAGIADRLGTWPLPAGQGWGLDCNCLQRLQSLGCAPGLLWGGQLPGHLPGEVFAITRGQAWKKNHIRF